MDFHEQLENCKVALQLWLETPAEKVVPQLRQWRCGTQACFGGHLAEWGYFKGLGVGATLDGAPYVQDTTGYHTTGYMMSPSDVSNYLFGDWHMFDQSDTRTRKASHALVVTRLNQRIKEIENVLAASS